MQGSITDVGGKYSIEVQELIPLLSSHLVGSWCKGSPGRESDCDNGHTRKIYRAWRSCRGVGYITEKANLTGAVDQVTTSTLENRTMSTTLTQGLKGVVPNLNISLLDGKPNQAPSYNIGINLDRAGRERTILIDGVEGDPSMINPNDIANISVLKDAASASIYGARVLSGVVLIHYQKSDQRETNITISLKFRIRKPLAVPDLVTEVILLPKCLRNHITIWENTSLLP